LRSDAFIGLTGFALVAASILGGLWLDHVRERPVYQRPAILIRPRFWIIYAAIRWVCFLTGWGLSAAVFPRSALGLALVLTAAWLWKRLLQGRRFRQRMIRRAFLREKERDPAASDVQVLQRILHSMHPRWGEELIEQIAADNPTPEGVSDMILRIERGALPIGFDPSRMLRRR
jgi:hypothetical protein